LWLSSPEIAVARVAARAKNAGHTVPENVIRRRYIAGLRNFMNLYIPGADSWVCYDNSGDEPILVAERVQGGSLRVEIPATWRKISGTVS
jgi:predicted ABC-type ATPase